MSKSVDPRLPADGKTAELEGKPGSAAFQSKYFVRDLQAGIITGVMAVALSVGIAIMSEYPIKVGLATVAFASFVAWITAWFRPGNYIGSPGIAAGLAPILAMGVVTFGLQNMAFIVFLTACMQAVIWKFNLQKYILKAVPSYLVEGLLAGIGLQIVLKFLGFAYEIPAGQVTEGVFLNAARIQMILISAAGFGLFVFLFSKFRDKQPAVPYFVIIVAGVVLAQFVSVPMLKIQDVDIRLALPLPNFAGPLIWLYAIGFAMMLAIVDVVEQVMSNAAIEKIDPLQRKCNSNNSLLAIWIANLGSSFFGGMKNLDGLAKSTTNQLAGAHTKFSVLIIGIVVTFFVFFSQYLEYLPKFALAAIMIFTGWKMILGLWNIVQHGPYELMLALLCGVLVYEIGIFEGLLIAMAVHGIVHYLVFSQADHMSTKDIIRKYFEKYKGDTGVD
ncbi:MAG: sulfate transporter [Syntrophaceae bacterium]|nr:MAG: sulfate transporter [Syntrophaceae bacterium]